MKGHADRFGLEMLDEKECLRLLATVEVGRLGVIEGGAVLILPVNFVVSDEGVVFRTAPGAKLRAAQRSPVTLEVDAVDPATRTGWSVLVRGRAEEITRFDAPAVRQLRELPLDPWAGNKPVWMRIEPTVVTGRRLAPFAAGQPATTAVREPPPFVVASDPPQIRIRRIDDRRGRLRHRRAAVYEAVDEAGVRVAVAGYDADVTSPTAEVTVELAPMSGVERVDAGGELLRALAAWAVVDGLRDLVLRGDRRDPMFVEVLEASSLPWTRVEVGNAATATLVLAAAVR
jgi:nitroimidazol reductase NimA-like FMN-containing flavoprotein (pyridoxamine 5'-phosphate oxidase superfamily)